MRFVRKSKLKCGMILGEPIKDADGKMLLREGQVLQPSYIEKIQQISTGNTILATDSKDDSHMISSVKYRIKNDLINMVGKSSFQELHILRSIRLSQYSFAQYESEEELIDEVLQDETVVGCMRDLLELDIYTFRHSINTAAYSYILGLAMDLYGRELYNLLVGALLHDYGKAFIKLNILNKPDKLTEKEYIEIKEHPTSGYHFLKDDCQLPEAQCIAALEHHERINGSGYPASKKENEISLTGRIMAVADVFDALIADRPYRKGMLPSEAMEFIMGGADTLFDHEIVRQFARFVIPFPVGTMVKLSNGSIGIVDKNYQDCCTRPRIRTLEKKNGNQYVDLKNDLGYKNVIISQIVMSA